MAYEYLFDLIENKYVLEMAYEYLYNLRLNIGNKYST